MSDLPALPDPQEGRKLRVDHEASRGTGRWLSTRDALDVWLRNNAPALLDAVEAVQRVRELCLPAATTLTDDLMRMRSPSYGIGQRDLATAVIRALDGSR